jgi:hypothetical protein
VYADASHTDCPDTAKSSHGYVIVTGGGPVSWSSRWQSVVALSTTESEYFALVHAGQTAVWVNKFMEDVYIPVERPIILSTDSQGGRSLTKQSANFTRVQHLHTRYHWLRDAVRNKDFNIKHIPGNTNPADIFTKPLAAPTLRRHLVTMGVSIKGEC